MRAPERHAALASILIGAHASPRAPHCVVVNTASVLALRLDCLERTAAAADAGDVVVYAIALQGSIVVRLLMLLTLGFRVSRAQQVLQSAGAARVHRYAVTPSLDRPTIAYEIGTPAAQYADRHLRPRAGRERLRAIFARIAGVDPSIGGVVVAGVKA